MVAISGSRPSANHTDRFYRESAVLVCSPAAPGRPTREPGGGVVAGGRHSLAAHGKIEAEPSHNGPSGSWSKLLSRSPRHPVDRPQDIEHGLNAREPRCRGEISREGITIIREVGQRRERRS